MQYYLIENSYGTGYLWVCFHGLSVVDYVISSSLLVNQIVKICNLESMNLIMMRDPCIPN